MKTPCIRCAVGADVFMTYDYALQQVWLEDLVASPEPNTGYPLCAVHAGRFSAPSGWTVTDQRDRAQQPTAARGVA